MPYNNEQIREMLKKISKGEWRLFHFSKEDDGKTIDKAAVYAGNYLSIIPNVRGEDEMVAAGCFIDNATFIATAPTIITQLLDREDEIKRKIEGMTGVGFNDDVVSRKAVLALFI